MTSVYSRDEVVSVKRKIRRRINTTIHLQYFMVGGEIMGTTYYIRFKKKKEKKKKTATEISPVYTRFDYIRCLYAYRSAVFF